MDIIETMSPSDAAFFEFYNECEKRFSATIFESAIPIIQDCIYKAKMESGDAKHCFYSPSKSNGWVVCPAYADRAAPWHGSQVPAVRGTIIHYFFEQIIKWFKGYVDNKKMDAIHACVFENSDWLGSPAGVESAKALVRKAIDLGLGNIQSEKFLLYEGLELGGDREFGGSIDLLGKVDDTVYVYDLKTGKHPVSPDCWQLKCYALLAQQHYAPGSEPSDGTFEFVLGIAQNGAIKEYTITRDMQKNHGELLPILDAIRAYEEIYTKRLLFTRNPQIEYEYNNLFQPNALCRFCSGCLKNGG